VQLKGAIEDNVLCLLVRSETHAPILALRLTRELFSTRVYQEIAEAALTHLAEYGKPPGTHI
jgi:hypothetical protein